MIKRKDCKLCFFLSGNERKPGLEGRLLQVEVVREKEVVERKCGVIDSTPFWAGAARDFLTDKLHDNLKSQEHRDSNLG